MLFSSFTCRCVSVSSVGAADPASTGTTLHARLGGMTYPCCQRRADRARLVATSSCSCSITPIGLSTEPKANSGSPSSTLERDVTRGKAPVPPSAMCCWELVRHRPRTWHGCRPARERVVRTRSQPCRRERADRRQPSAQIRVVVISTMCDALTPRPALPAPIDLRQPQPDPVRRVPGRPPRPGRGSRSAHA